MKNESFVSMNILLNAIDSIKAFESKISKIDEAADLVSGRYVIDAKSVMGRFSLDLSKPIELRIHTTDKTILNNFAEFEAK